MQAHKDDRLPHLELAPSNISGGAPRLTGRVLHFNLVTDGTISDILWENMTNDAEAVRLWSPIRVERDAEAVVGWANAMLSMVIFCGEASHLHMQAILYRHLFMGGDATDDPGMDGVEALVATDGNDWMYVGKAFWRVLVWRFLVEGCVDAMVAFLESPSVPKAIRLHPDFANMSKTLRDKLLNNIQIRPDIIELFCLLHIIQELLAIVGEAVEEWGNNTISGSKSTTSFSNARPVHELSSRLSPPLSTCATFCCAATSPSSSTRAMALRDSPGRLRKPRLWCISFGACLSSGSSSTFSMVGCS